MRVFVNATPVEVDAGTDVRGAIRAHDPELAARLGSGSAYVTDARAIELPPETTANLYAMTPEERMAEGIGMLPGSLSDAIDTMERSELVAEALGEHVFEWFLRNKRAEWRDYKTQITQFELDRYYRNV